MTAAIIPMPRRHGDVHASVPQPGAGPDFQIGDTVHGAWAGRPGLSTSHIPAAHVPDVVRGLLRAVAHQPQVPHELVADLLDVLALYGHTDGDDAA